MKQHKIIIGEWVSVYVNQTMIVESDKDIENMTADELAKLLDNDDNTKIVDTCQSDYDWSTEEHEDWDRHEDSGFTYIEEIKGGTDGNNGN
jgi:hypothetical protein